MRVATFALMASCASNAAHRIQYLPGPQTAEPDADLLPPAPTALEVVPGLGFLSVRTTVEFQQPEDLLEVFASVDNNRTNAVRIASGRVVEFTYEQPPGARLYWWARVRRPVEGSDVFSLWFPSSATAGVTALTFGHTGVRDAEFTRATDGTYWLRSHPAKMPISLTGGEVGGYITMDFTETFASASTRTLQPAGPLPVRLEGEPIRIAVRYRRISTIVSGNDKKLQVDIYTFSTSDQSTAPQVALEDDVDLVADLNTLPLGVWQSTVLDLDPTGVYPFYRVRLIGLVNGSGAGGGALEVDYFNIRLL